MACWKVTVCGILKWIKKKNELEKIKIREKIKYVKNKEVKTEKKIFKNIVNSKIQSTEIICRFFFILPSFFFLSYFSSSFRCCYCCADVERKFARSKWNVRIVFPPCVVRFLFVYFLSFFLFLFYQGWVRACMCWGKGDFFHD